MQSKVLKGKNNFLFLQNDSNDVLKQHTGEVKIDEKSLDVWKLSLEGRKKFCDENNISYFVQISPDKHRIYNDYLPDAVMRSCNTPGDQFEKLAQNILGDNFLNPSVPLIKAKKKELVFHKTDTHWNAKGCYITYEQFIDSLDFPINKYIERDYKELVKVGDLGIKLNPKQKSIFIEP